MDITPFWQHFPLFIRLAVFRSGLEASREKGNSISGTCPTALSKPFSKIVWIIVRDARSSTSILILAKQSYSGKTQEDVLIKPQRQVWGGITKKEWTRLDLWRVAFSQGILNRWNELPLEVTSPFQVAPVLKASWFPGCDSWATLDTMGSQSSVYLIQNRIPNYVYNSFFASNPAFIFIVYPYCLILPTSTLHPAQRISSAYPDISLHPTIPQDPTRALIIQTH